MDWLLLWLRLTMDGFAGERASARNEKRTVEWMRAMKIVGIDRERLVVRKP